MLCCVTALTAGCGPHRGPAVEMRLDIAAAPMARQDRLARAVSVLAPSAPAVRTLRVGLSQLGGLGAWAWQDGRIKVTPALVDLLDDAELTAAVAHEVAHLLADGHLGTVPAAINGADAEHAADALGCRLLVAAGLSPSAMTRMLEHLAAALPGESGFTERATAARFGGCADDAR